MCECELCPCDPRAVRQYDACEAIATSSGKNDSGTFELNFNDERFLHFEYRGAISRWRIEMCRENNYWDRDTMSDLLMKVCYTAREGGEPLRCAARECARKHLPGDGWCFFDVRHDFPDSRELLRMAASDEKRHKQLNLRFTRRMFPYVPGCPEVRINRITLLFEASQPEHKCCEVGECACLEPKPRNAYEVGMVIRSECEGNREHKRVESACVATGGCPNLYVGNFEIERDALLGEVAARFEFSHEIKEMRWVYLLGHYVCRLSGCEDCGCPEHRTSA